MKKTTLLSSLHLQTQSFTVWAGVLVFGLLMLQSVDLIAQKKLSPKKIQQYKSKVDIEVQNQAKLTQVMVDKLFSFAELGFQEVETKEYVTGLLEKEGFTINNSIEGIPTAWTASWGSGKPVIALGSDVDCIPKASQMPGVAYHNPMVEGAPGHGEGHNSGVPVNIAAALALKKWMSEENISGTLVIWPGVAEELVATKAYYARDGLFDDVDVCIFTHVSNNMNVSWGAARGTGLVSVEYTFKGESAHSAGSPWRGRSALDAVELMNVGWNFRREHLSPLHRSHYVIVDGGDQPNVVPSTASVWYYFRGITYKEIKDLFEAGTDIAKGAAMMTNTEMEYKILGSAWPRHFNRPMAEAMDENIKKIGLPTWSAEDQTLAKALQQEVGSDTVGLPTKLRAIGKPVERPISGGSDDIGDISWTVPTITLRFPANIPGLQGHHWSNAVAMATPIAHKGSVYGARAVAMTVVDLLTNPTLLKASKDYFAEQTKNQKYVPLISDTDVPPAYINSGIMNQFKPQLEKFYYDETKYDTYLEQLGITYPTIRKK